MSEGKRAQDRMRLLRYRRDREGSRRNRRQDGIDTRKSSTDQRKEHHQAQRIRQDWYPDEISGIKINFLDKDNVTTQPHRSSPRGAE